MDKKNSIYKFCYSLHLEASEKVLECIALQIGWGRYCIIVCKQVLLINHYAMKQKNKKCKMLCMKKTGRNTAIRMRTRLQF